MQRGDQISEAEIPSAVRLPAYSRAVTYSIVARDGETGELGVAVQTRSFGVGRAVPWALAGIGAVATQSLTDKGYGPLALELLRAGKSPADALAALLAADRDRAVRQVAIVDKQGRAAAHTGSACIAEAGHVAGDGWSAQANMMRSADVWPAMAESYQAAEGSLAQKLLAALEAAEAAGGDFRGRQAAAVLVVDAESAGKPWDERVSDLRVDDHPEPLQELRRLLQKEEAYRLLNRLGPDDPSDDAFDAARAAGIGADELLWYEVALAWKARRPDEVERRLQKLIELEPRWAGARAALREVVPEDPEPE
jgi:uncharacterized Ntn-hydrolase superfamily protein